jgi:hypothetical protein
MPYQIIQELAFLRLVFLNTITPQDLVSLAAELAAIEHALLVAPHRLTDLSQVSMTELSYPDVLAFVEHRKAERLRNSVKSALVAPMPVQVGFARMFQILNDHPQIEVQLFETLAEAEAWLMSP